MGASVRRYSYETEHSGDETDPESHSICEYNVLVLGGWSTKSTLIDYMCKHFTSSAVNKHKTLASGVSSNTPKARFEALMTDLLEHEVVNINSIQVTFDTDAPRPKMSAQFNVIDTPEFHTTSDNVQQHVQKVFHSLIEAKTIHLIIVALHPRLFTRLEEDTIKCYFDMFPDFKGIIAFVHTDKTCLNSHMRERLNKTMGGTFPQFVVDCNGTTKSISDYIAVNTLQRILELAAFNRPVNMRRTVINKTRKMRHIDELLWDKLETTTVAIERNLQLMDPDEGWILVEIYKRSTRVQRLEAKIKALEEFFVHHDVESLGLLHEDRLEMEQDANGQGKKFSIRYPETGELDIPIVHRDLLCHRIDVISEIASKSWQAAFQRTSSRPSVLHFKIYTTKSNLHKAEIQEKRKEHAKLQRDLQAAICHRDSCPYRIDHRKQKIKETVDKQNEGIQILDLVASEFLAPEVFKALIDSDAYGGDDDDCVKRVRSVYMALMKGSTVKHDIVALEEYVFFKHIKHNGSQHTPTNHFFFWPIHSFF